MLTHLHLKAQVILTVWVTHADAVGLGFPLTHPDVTNPH